MSGRAKILLILLAVFVVVGVIAAVNSSQLPGDMLVVETEHRSCQLNTDCVLVTTRCSCDCGSAVNAKYQGSYAAALQTMCADYSGIQCGMDCPYTAACLDGRCHRIPDGTGQNSSTE